MFMKITRNIENFKKYFFLNARCEMHRQTFLVFELVFHPNFDTALFVAYFRSDSLNSRREIATISYIS